MQKIGEFSLELKTDGNFTVHNTWNGGHPYDGDYKKFISCARQSLQNWLSEYHQKHRMTFNEEKSVFLPEKESRVEDQTEADTWIFPSIQMGPFNIKHDSGLTEKFLLSGAEGSRFKFATGYFNLTNEYKNVMLNSSKASF